MGNDAQVRRDTADRREADARLRERLTDGPVNRDSRDLVIEARADAEAAARAAGRRAARRAAAKAIVCRAITALPCRWWPIASAIARRIWPGLRDA